MVTTNDAKAREIALEEARLREESARDVQRQLRQQRLQVSEAKAGESITKAADKVLSAKGEAKIAPGFTLAEHAVEAVINDTAGDVEVLREDLRGLKQRLSPRIGVIREEKEGHRDSHHGGHNL